MSGSTRVGVTGYSGHPHRGLALARCVDVPADVFADKHWGRAPLLTQGRPAIEFTDLFNAAAVDEVVSERGLRTPFLRMAKGGEIMAPGKYTRSGGAGAKIGDQVADDKVLGLLACGSTLVLQGLHRTWPPLMRFGSELAAELGHPVQINAYITPPQNQGFASHYDNHDVFVLQIAGHKRWRIHEPVLASPLPGENWEHRRDDVTARAREAPLIDTVLAPGDALYLPRGYLHSASALGELTVHLTVGVHPVTHNVLLHRLVDAAGTDEAFRASLPMGADLADPVVLAPHLAETARRLIQFAQHLTPELSERVAAGVGAALAEDTRPEPIGPLAQGAAAATLTGATAVRARSGLRYALTIDEEACALRVLDKTITMPASVAPALPTVLDGATFTPNELPGLDGESRLTLVRRLLGEGVVVPAGTP